MDIATALCFVEGPANLRYGFEADLSQKPSPLSAPFTRLLKDDGAAPIVRGVNIQGTNVRRGKGFRGRAPQPIENDETLV